MTIRGIPDAVEREIRKMARQKGISLLPLVTVSEILKG